MSAYDNPKIVNDQSAMAWAQAFNVSGVMAQAAKDWRAERLYQKKIHLLIMKVVYLILTNQFLQRGIGT